jgi:hypothetical protein
MESIMTNPNDNPNSAALDDVGIEQGAHSRASENTLENSAAQSSEPAEKAQIPQPSDNFAPDASQNPVVAPDPATSDPDQTLEADLRAEATRCTQLGQAAVQAEHTLQGQEDEIIKQKRNGTPEMKQALLATYKQGDRLQALDEDVRQQFMTSLSYTENKKIKVLKWTEDLSRNLFIGLVNCNFSGLSKSKRSVRATVLLYAAEISIEPDDFINWLDGEHTLRASWLPTPQLASIRILSQIRSKPT